MATTRQINTVKVAEANNVVVYHLAKCEVFQSRVQRQSTWKTSSATPMYPPHCGGRLQAKACRGVSQPRAATPVPICLGLGNFHLRTLVRPLLGHTGGSTKEKFTHKVDEALLPLLMYVQDLRLLQEADKTTDKTRILHRLGEKQEWGAFQTRREMSCCLPLKVAIKCMSKSLRCMEDL